MWILLVFLHILRINQDIVNRNQHKLVKIGMKYIIHKMHACGWGVSEPKMETRKLITFVMSFDCSLVDILIPYPYLMVPRMQVNF